MPVLKRPRIRRGTVAPEEVSAQDTDRQDEGQQEQSRHHPLHHRRQPQPGQESEHHAGQRGHHLDHRLDVGLDARMHELAHVYGGQERQRHREHQRVERALERAVDQRGQAELGLEVIGAAGGLPDVGGLRVALVPDLSEDGLERDLRMRVVEPPLAHRALVADHQDAVRLRSEHHRMQVPFRRLQREERVSRRSVVDPHAPRRIPGREALVALRRVDRHHRPGVSGELVDPGQPTLPASRWGHHLPGGDPSALVADHEGPVADQEPQRRHREPRLARDRHLVQAAGRLAVAHVVVDHRTGGGADEQVLAAPVERERRDLAGRLDIDRRERLLPPTASHQRLLLHHGLDHQRPRADLRHRQGAAGWLCADQAHQGPLLLRIERRGGRERRRGNHLALAILEGHLEPHVERDDPAVGGADEMPPLAEPRDRADPRAVQTRNRHPGQPSLGLQPDELDDTRRPRPSSPPHGIRPSRPPRREPAPRRGRPATACRGARRSAP